VPVYDYRCEKGHRFEVVQSMSDKPIKKCEECGAPAQRVLHAPAIHFKGSGFHNTDYGTKTRPKEQPAAAPSGGAAGSGGSGGSAGSSGGSDGGGGSSKSVGLDKV
jgi:putative FmdB family regulatory protein